MQRSIDVIEAFFDLKHMSGLCIFYAQKCICCRLWWFVIVNLKKKNSFDLLRICISTPEYVFVSVCVCVAKTLASTWTTSTNMNIPFFFFFFYWCLSHLVIELKNYKFLILEKLNLVLRFSCSFNFILEFSILAIRSFGFSLISNRILSIYCPIN